MALEGTEPESSLGPSTKWRGHLNISQMDSGENKRQPPVSRREARTQQKFLLHPEAQPRFSPLVVALVS